MNWPAGRNLDQFERNTGKMEITRSKGIILGLICLLGFGYAATQAVLTPQFVSFSAAQPVLKAYMSSLPAALKPSGQLSAVAWDEWVRQQDQEVRARIQQGEENTLTNLLRLGVTY